MLTLGIETSCDETGVAVYSPFRGLLAHALYSQVIIHAEYGGVVPELASRDHIRKLVPLIRKVVSEAGTDVSAINGIAYTGGPGLAGALLVGAAVSRSLAWTLNIPSLAVHHMEGHLLAPMLEENPPAFPFLALLVSGGHTLLVEVRGIGLYKTLGESVDDAVGEAFDKAAQMLGLGYPGGPALAKLAEAGNPARFAFPRPMTDRPGLDFSFSGLKTYTLNTLRTSEDNQKTRADVARAFEDAVVDTLLIKCRRAIRQTGLTRLVVAGGVGANKSLREGLEAMVVDEKAKVYFPRIEFCTDNGAMIAFAGCLRLQAGQHEGTEFGAVPRWPLDTLSAPEIGGNSST